MKLAVGLAIAGDRQTAEKEWLAVIVRIGALPACAPHQWHDDCVRFFRITLGRQAEIELRARLPWHGYARRLRL